MDIPEFVFKRNEKILRELVTKTWQMESAKEKLEASKASRIDIVKTHLTSDCGEGCSGQWLLEVLVLNGIDTFQFVTVAGCSCLISQNDKIDHTLQKIYLFLEGSSLK